MTLEAPNVVKLADHMKHEKAEVVIGVDEHRVADEALAALVQGGAPIFQRGGILATVVTEPDESSSRIRRHGGARIAPMPKPRLREMLTEYVRFLKVTDDELKGAHPPGWLPNALSCRGRWDGVRPLDGIVECPVLKPDGLLLMEPGYDRATGLLYAPGLDAGSLAIDPTSGGATKAVELLLDVVCDFPFVDKSHIAAWLAALLTPLARHAFKGSAPLFLFDAASRGSGKSMLADIIGLVATGRPMARMAPTTDEAEERKRITSVVISGDPVVLIDNVASGFGTPALDAALTGELWKDRLLGENTIIECPVSATFFATGNNTAVRGDLSRRVLVPRLESPVEHPEERDDFKRPELIAWVEDNRAALLGAALSILHGYCQAGRPRQRVKPFGSFAGWNHLVASAVVWAGLPDPNATRTAFAEMADTEASALAALLGEWIHLDPNGQGVTVSRLLAALDIQDPKLQGLRDALCELVPTRHESLPGAHRVGIALNRNRKRVIGGRYLDIDGKTGGSARWIVRGEQRGARGDRGVDSTPQQQQAFYGPGYQAPVPPPVNGMGQPPPWVAPGWYPPPPPAGTPPPWDNREGRS